MTAKLVLATFFADLSARFTKLFSSRFLLCLAGLIPMALDRQWAYVAGIIFLYVVADSATQWVNFLKTVDKVVEVFKGTPWGDKADKFLDAMVAVMEAKMGTPIGFAGGSTATVPGVGQVQLTPAVETPIADALGKF